MKTDKSIKALSDKSIIGQDSWDRFKAFYILLLLNGILFLSSVYAFSHEMIKWENKKTSYETKIDKVKLKLWEYQHSISYTNELIKNRTENITIKSKELEYIEKEYNKYNAMLHDLFEVSDMWHVNEKNWEIFRLKCIMWNFRNSIKGNNTESIDIKAPNGNLSSSKGFIKTTLERHYPFSIASLTEVRIELLDYIRSILPRYYHIHYCSTLKNDSRIFDESDVYNSFNIIIYNKYELILNRKGSFNINVLPKNGSNLPDTGCVAWTQFGLNKMYNKDLVFLSTHIDSYPGLNKNDESTLTDEDKLLELITQLSVGNNNTKMDNTQECDNIYLHENPLTTIKNFVDEYVNKNSITTKRTYTIMSSDWNKISCKNNWNNNDPDYTLYKNTNIDDDWVDLKTLCYGCEKRLMDDEDDDELQPNNGECNGKHIQWPFMLDGYTKTRVLSYTVDNTPSAIKSDVDGIPVSLELQLLS